MRAEKAEISQDRAENSAASRRLSFTFKAFVITVDGIKVPFTIVNSNVAQSVTIKIDKVEQNVPIDDAVFVKKEKRQVV